MLEPGTPMMQAIAAAIGLLLLAFAWRSVASLPGFARWSLRIVLAAIIIVPFALIVLEPDYHKYQAPPKDVVAMDRPAAKKKMAPKSSEPATTSRDGDEREVVAAPKPVPPPAPSAPAAEHAAPPAKLDPEAEIAKAPPAARPDAVTAQPPAPIAPIPPREERFDDDAPSYKMERRPAAGSEPADMATRNGESRGREADAPKSSTPGSTRGLEGFARPQDGLGMSGTGTGGGGSSVGRIGAGGAPSSADRAQPSAGAQAPPPVAAAPSPPAPSPPPPSPPPPPPVSATSAGPEEDWTVVPVYYGTDRARVPNDKRIDYGSDRGRRLELGRALVSVPKAHEVPQIERPWAITIPYFKVKIYEEKEDPKKHFMMQEIKSLSEAEMLALVKERLAASARYKDHAFVFVHGYNTTFDSAVYRAAQIAYDIKFDGAPFVYSWPSGGGIASYTYDRESAAQAENYLGDFVKIVAQKSGAKSVSVIAHSMGNQLLLRVLQDLQRTKPPGVEISQIIFAAPDVDRDSFEAIATQLKDFAKGGITLYTAANDRALGVSRRFHGGVPRAGDVPVTGPLVMPGIDTIDATAVSMDSLGLHHSGYAESNALLQDIGLLIQTGERPPGKRVPILQQVTTDKGPYWRYPATP